MINKVTIYGERCSGTNYLETLIKKNFDATITWEYGWKHFFGFNDLSNSDDTIFICITRDICKWLNSLYREMWHLPLKYLEKYRDISEEQKLNIFLNEEFYSIDEINNNNEIMTDRNIYTGERYINIFEMRHTKNKFLIEDMPNKVKNYILIRYEDLMNDFENTMTNIKDKGLKLKENINFPVNQIYYKDSNSLLYVSRENYGMIPNSLILENKNLIPTYEIKLGYL